MGKSGKDKIKRLEAEVQRLRDDAYLREQEFSKFRQSHADDLSRLQRDQQSALQLVRHRERDLSDTKQRKEREIGALKAEVQRIQQTARAQESRMPEPAQLDKGPVVSELELTGIDASRRVYREYGDNIKILNMNNVFMGDLKDTTVPKLRKKAEEAGDIAMLRDVTDQTIALLERTLEVNMEVADWMVYTLKNAGSSADFQADPLEPVEEAEATCTTSISDQSRTPTPGLGQGDLSGQREYPTAGPSAMGDIDPITAHSRVKDEADSSTKLSEEDQRLLEKLNRFMAENTNLTIL